MAVTTLSNLPEVIEGGSTYIWALAFTGYPVGTWNCDFVLQISGSPPIVLRADTSGINFLFTLSTAATAAIPQGQYTYAYYVTEIATGQRTTAQTGILQVIPDLTQTAPQSTAAVMLANVEDAITKLTKNQFSSVSVGGVTYTRAELGSLLASRTRLQAEVIREQNTAKAFRGIDTSGVVATRFGSGGEGQPFPGKPIGC